MPSTTLSPGRPAAPSGPPAPGVPTTTARQATLTLPATPGDARTIRHWSAHALTCWGMVDADLDDALLVIGELAANAVEHGGEDMTVALTLSGNLLNVAVSDDGPAGPSCIPGSGCEADPEDEHGRGLMLVEALSLAWSAGALPDGGVILSAQLSVRST